MDFNESEYTENETEIDAMRSKIYKVSDFHPLFDRLSVQDLFIRDLPESDLAAEEPKFNELWRRLEKIKEDYNNFVKDAEINELRILISHYKHSKKKVNRYQRLLKLARRGEITSYDPLTKVQLRKRYKINWSEDGIERAFHYLVENDFIDYNTELLTFKNVFSLEEIEKEDRIIWTDQINRKISYKTLFILLSNTVTKINHTYNYLPFIYANFVTPEGDFDPDSLEPALAIFNPNEDFVLKKYKNFKKELLEMEKLFGIKK